MLPIIYGPYFVAIAADYTHSGLMYVMPVMFTVILCSLDDMQEHLENPFDRVGDDDIVIEADKFLDRLSL
jgi:hypothetical protein